MSAEDAPLAVRLFSYQPGTDPDVDGLPHLPQRWDRHITHELRNLSYRKEIPQGYKSATFSIDRRLAEEAPDLAPYQGVAIYDRRSAQTLWEGTIEDTGRGVDDNGETWEVTATGSGGHAADETRPLVYIDRRLDAWEMVNASINGWTVGLEIRDTDDEPSIAFRWPRGTGMPAGQISCSIAYRHIMECGQRLARFGGTFDCGRTDASGNRHFQGIIRVNGNAFVAVESQNWTTTETAFAATIATDWSDVHDNMRLRITWEGAAVGTVPDDTNWARALGVYVRAVVFDQFGDEIVTAYGNAFVRAEQVIKDLLGRMLNRYDGANASVPQASFEINHLAYTDGTTAAQVLDDMMLLHPDWYWAAWESNPLTNKYRFEWKQWPTTIGYDADISGGYDSASGDLELYNKVVVRYNDFMGRTKSVTRTQNVPELTATGVTRSPAPIDLADELGESAAAAQVGDAFLAEHRYAPNAGTLRISGPIFDHVAGRTVQPWEIEPGRLMRVRGILPRIDGLNATARDAVTVFKVVATDYDLASNSTICELDSKPRTVAQLLARMEQRRLRKR